jgi:hypothetical protein
MKLGELETLKPGDPAPDVALSQLDGTKLRLSTPRGGPVVLSFLPFLFDGEDDGPFAGNELEPADAHDSFWFDWAAFHPDTEVWSGE